MFMSLVIHKRDEQSEVSCVATHGNAHRGNRHSKDHRGDVLMVLFL